MTIFSEKYATIFNINLLSLKCKIYLNIDEACARVERPLYLLKIINKSLFPVCWGSRSFYFNPPIIFN